MEEAPSVDRIDVLTAFVCCDSDGYLLPASFLFHNIFSDRDCCCVCSNYIEVDIRPL